jgi:hypothetical protein
MSLTLTDREIKALVEKELDRAPQYAFERKVFCDTFYKIFGEDFSFFDLFDYSNITYESFILWNDEDTWYIYSKQISVAVSGYKNLGRVNKCNNEFLDYKGLQIFFLLLREEYYKSKEKIK